MLRLPTCAFCGQPIKQPSRGRPRAYCDALCRQRAHRDRLSAASKRLDGFLEMENEVEATLASLPDDMLGLPADADKAVLETVSFGWMLVLRLGRCSERARRPLDWRCGQAAEEIATVLRRRFRP